MHYNEEVTRAQRKEGFVLMGPSVPGDLGEQGLLHLLLQAYIKTIQFQCEYTGI